MPSKEPTSRWKPTHRLQHRGKVVDVYLLDGLAFLQEDWEARTVTYSEYDEEEGWLFQGLPGPELVEEL